jgi:hypothetical protein
MYNTPSLARPDWQAKVTDGELRKVITEGRGRMPATQLSRPMLDGMVRLVRSLVRQRAMTGGSMPPGHPPIDVPPAPAARPSASAGQPPTEKPATRKANASPPKPGASGQIVPDSQ